MIHEVHQRGGEEAISNRERQNFDAHAGAQEKHETHNFENDPDSKYQSLSPVTPAEDGVSGQRTECGRPHSRIRELEEWLKLDTAADRPFHKAQHEG
jgi:hypothetical protein